MYIFFKFEIWPKTIAEIRDFCFFGMLWSWGQAEPKETDSIPKKYLIVVGDTITKQSIDLDEV